MSNRVEITPAEMQQHRISLWQHLGGKCQNCGTFISLKRLTTWNFAHWKTKDGMSREDRFRCQLLVCSDLHKYHHSKAGNLSKKPCPKKYLEQFGRNGKFWKKLVVDKLGLEW